MLPEDEGLVEDGYAPIELACVTSVNVLHNSGTAHSLSIFQNAVNYLNETFLREPFQGPGFTLTKRNTVGVKVLVHFDLN